MSRRTLLWAIVSIATISASGEEPPRTAAELYDAAKERFLLEAQIVRTRGAPGGVTLSRRATLRLDGLEHDAHIQTIDEAKPLVNLSGGAEVDFRDSYRNNVAAYRLDRLLGLGMIPVTVVRSHEGRTAAFTWWVDDVKMSEKERYTKKIRTPDAERWNEQIFVVRAFDQLIYNADRNLGNLLIDGGWRVWMIDHTRAFKIFKTLRSEKELGPRCERHLLEALRGLDEPTLRATMKDLLSQGQIEGLLGRRDRILTHYDAKVADLGEEAVLYDLPPRVGPEPTALTPSLPTP
jgi:hypothetical protein